MPEIQEIASGLLFPEGPVALPDGTLLVVEIQGRTLTRIRSDGGREVVAELGGGPNGAAIGPDGRCYVCNNGGFKFHKVGAVTFPGLIPDDYDGGRIRRSTWPAGRARCCTDRAATSRCADPMTIWCSTAMADSISPIRAR